MKLDILQVSDYLQALPSVQSLHLIQVVRVRLWDRALRGSQCYRWGLGVPTCLDTYSYIVLI